MPAPPDTAVARFSWPQDAGRAPLLTLWPDTLAFGQDALVILDHGEGTVPLPLDSLRVDVPWLEPVPDGAVSVDPQLPPPEGPRQLARFRVYREGPWRAAWADGPSGRVQVVEGRVDDPAAVEPVRDPRAIGGIPEWLFTALVGVAGPGAGGAAALWWRWRRHRHGWQPVHRTLPPPAWLDAALALRDLEQRSLLGREHLDGLAAVLRRFLQDRFFLAATEMTAPEVLAAARTAGWRQPVMSGFAELLAACDDARYAPDHVGSQEVYRAVQGSLDLMEAVRIQPVWTPVAPDRLADARAAWALLRQRYPSAADEPGRQAC